MKCPIEGIECGNASTNTDGRKVCAGGNYGDMDLNGWDIIGFTRCPYPSRIKEVPPDPGEGYELVPYNPKTRIESDWSVWNHAFEQWDKSIWVGSSMSAPGSIPFYRRRKYAVCPVSGERCKHFKQQIDWPSCGESGDGWHSLNHTMWETCPWPSKMGV